MAASSARTELKIAAVVSLALLALVARGPRPSTAPAPLPSAAVASSSSPAVASSSSPAVATSPAVAPSAGAPEAPLDPGFDAFAEHLRASCEPEAKGESTADMVAAGHALSFCLHGAIDREIAALDPSLRAAIAVGPPDPVDAHDWSGAWRRLVDSACHLDDAHASQIGAMRRAGSMRRIEGAYCWVRPFLETAYLLHTLRVGDAGAFHARVAAARAAGEARAAGVPSALASAERMRERAPENSLFNEECEQCVLSDSDWRRVVLRLRALPRESSALAAAVCQAWPALAGELGGDPACAQGVSTYFLSWLDEVPGPFEREGDDTKLDERQPAKDPDYRAFVEPISDRCRPPESLHYSVSPLEEEYVACLRASLLAQGSSELEAAYERYVSRLCAVEGRVDRTDMSLAFDEGWIYRVWKGRTESLQCPGSMYARGAFLLASMRGDDVAAFSRHLQHRAAWSERVEQGVAEVRRVASLPECKSVGDQWSKACRPREAPRAEWSALLVELKRLDAEALALGEKVCAAWPGLTARLDGAASCKTAMGRYFSSAGTYLGLAAIRN